MYIFDDKNYKTKIHLQIQILYIFEVHIKLCTCQFHNLKLRTFKYMFYYFIDLTLIYFVK